MKALLQAIDKFPSLHVSALETSMPLVPYQITLQPTAGGRLQKGISNPSIHLILSIACEISFLNQ